MWHEFCILCCSPDELRDGSVVDFNVFSFGLSLSFHLFSCTLFTHITFENNGENYSLITLDYSYVLEIPHSGRP